MTETGSVDFIPEDEEVEAEPALAGRVAKGTAWVFTGRMVSRGMVVVRVLVLAALLTPTDFGLYAIVMLAVMTLETLSQTGFDTALIQRKTNTEVYLDTVWTLHVVRGLVLATLLFLGAPLVARFYKEPSLVLLLRVTCPYVLCRGFENIGILYFHKDLQFHKQFVLDAVSQGVALVVGIILAYQLKSVWALIWATLTARALYCLLSYVLHPYRPKLRLVGARAREVYRFGRWLWMGAIGSFLLSQGSHAVVGKIVSVAALGIYQMAYWLSNMAATEISHTISIVLYPAYCRISDDAHRLTKAYLRSLQLLLFLVFPLCVGIALFVGGLTHVVLKPKWLGIILPAQILAVWGFRRAYMITVSKYFVSVGRPKVPTVLLLVKLGFLTAIVYPFTTTWGITGAAAALIVATLPVDVVGVVMLKRAMTCSWADFARPWITPVVSCVAGVLGFFVVQTAGVNVTTLSGFTTLLVVFGLCYAGAAYVLDRRAGFPLRTDVVTVFQGLRTDKVTG